jgi:zinc protease
LCVKKKRIPYLSLNRKESNQLKILNKKIAARLRVPRGVVASLLWIAFILVFAAVVQAASVTDGAERYTLDNGLTVILKQDRSAPVAAVQVWVKTGSANETEAEAGITHQIEHMIFKGTPTRPTGEIARAIEAAGGRINAYTSLDRTVYYVEIPAAQVDTGLEVLLDAVQHSLFDPEELEREKEVVLEEYRRSLDIPEWQLGWDMMALCYQEHPYGRPIIGYEETIRSFDREAIMAYVDKWYTPRNMVVVAVGDFDTRQALEKIKGLVRDFPERSGKEPSRPKEPPQTHLRKIIKKDQVQQVYLNLAWHIPEMTHEDMYPLSVLEIILGHGRSSRLYTRLKMDANLVTTIDAGTYALEDPGLFSIDATLSPDKLDAALAAIGQEISGLTVAPISHDELAQAKTLSEADFVFDMEDMSGQARTLAFFQVMTGDMANADHYLERIQQVTRADVLRVAREYFRPQNLSIGILGPEQSEISLKDEAVAALFTPPRPEAGVAAATTPGREPGGPAMTILPNGMRLIIKQNPRIPAVSMTAALLGGTRLEPEGKWGISGFAADMLTRGTDRRNAAQIARTVESWAGNLNGFSGRNSLGVSGRFLSKDLCGGLELMADVLLNPTFPQEEMEKVREDILAGIRAKKDRPARELFDLFYETLYPNNPYGHPQSGTRETIQSITRADLEAWYNSVAVPSNLVLTLVGDVDPDQVIPFVETLFETLPQPDKRLPKITPEPALTKPRTAHIERPGAQTHLIVGYLGAGIGTPLDAPMALVKTALAGQGGRLFTELRDKQSLAYAIMAFRSPGIDTGAFGAYMACDPAKAETAVKGIFAEFERVRDKGLTQEELDEAKRYLLGNLRIGLQTNGSQAMQMTLDELYGLGYDHLPTYIQEIEAVTPEDVRQAARQIILPDRYVLVTVGPDAGPPPAASEDKTHTEPQ